MSQYKIIVVDDDPIIRMDMKEMLEEEYCVVAEGKNGQEAIELAYKHHPDLIIMDIKMPVMDGLKASEIIRKMNYDTSILLLTAYSQKEMVQDAKKTGVIAYLVKPVSEENLLPAVEIALSQREQLQSLKQDIGNLQQSMEDRKIIERVKGLLMQSSSFSEEEAYQWLRKKSMSERKTIVEISKVYLRSVEKEQE